MVGGLSGQVWGRNLHHPRGMENGRFVLLAQQGCHCTPWVCLVGVGQKVCPSPPHCLWPLLHWPLGGSLHTGWAPGGVEDGVAKKQPLFRHRAGPRGNCPGHVRVLELMRHVRVFAEHHVELFDVAPSRKSAPDGGRRAVSALPLTPHPPWCPHTVGTVHAGE